MTDIAIAIKPRTTRHNVGLMNKTKLAKMIRIASKEFRLHESTHEEKHGELVSGKPWNEFYADWIIDNWEKYDKEGHPVSRFNSAGRL